MHASFRRLLAAVPDLLWLIGADTRLRRVAGTGGGEWAGPCPFCGGRDRLRVQPARGRWWCRQCSPDARWHDAIAYLQRRDGLSVQAALARLVGHVPQPAGLPHGVEHETELPSAAWRSALGDAVQRAAEQLAGPTGAGVRRYLAERGITAETARRWRLGYQPQPAELTGDDGAVLWLHPGLVIPWYAAGELWNVKVRRLGHLRNGPRYLSVRGGKPYLFGADTLADHHMAVLVEGELDALLLWQEAGDLLGVASLGSASTSPAVRALLALSDMPRLYAVYDADAAGTAGLLRLHAALPRVRVLSLPAAASSAPGLAPNDITDCHRAGCNLRAWLQQATAEPPLSSITGNERGRTGG